MVAAWTGAVRSLGAGMGPAGLADGSDAGVMVKRMQVTQLLSPDLLVEMPGPLTEMQRHQE